MGSHKHAPGRFRPILTTVVVIVLLTLGWVGLEVWIAYTLKPSSDVVYAKQVREINEGLRRGSGDDIWPLLVEIGELHEAMLSGLKTEDGRPWYDLGNGYAYEFLPITDYDYALSLASEEFHSTNRPWDEILDELNQAKLLAERAVRQLDVVGITELLDRVAASHVSIRPIDEHAKDGELIDFAIHGKMRSVARTLRASAARASSRGDWRRYLLAMEQGMALGQHLESQSIFIDYLVGCAISELFYDQLQSDIVRGIPSDVACSMRQIVARQERARDPAEVIGVERLWALHTTRRYFSDSGRFVHTEFAGTQPRMKGNHWLHNMQSLWMPKWDSIADEIDNRYGEFADFLTLPRHKRYDKWAYIQPDMMKVVQATNPLDSATFSNEIWFLGDLFDRRETVRAGVHMLLAIECFAYETGRYPVHLDDLVPEYLEELPPDVYSVDGRSWIYKLDENLSRRRLPFILYSVGIDGVDNGGHVSVGTNPGRALNHGMFGDDTTGSDYVVTSAEKQGN